LEYCLDQYCDHNVFGQIKLNKIHPNRASMLATELQIKVTLRRLPNVTTFQHVDDCRFNFFTKSLWDGLYDGCQGYTLIFLPHYFDFVRMKNFLKNRNAQVAMISEYTPNKDCMRNRQLFENGEKPILIVTERALVF